MLFTVAINFDLSKIENSKSVEIRLGKRLARKAHEFILFSLVSVTFGRSM
jgi:hypothetical protein